MEWKPHGHTESLDEVCLLDLEWRICSVWHISCICSRDRLAFSKSILRRFIRDCVDRDAAVASPWTVKPAIAERYGVNTIMPEETRRGVETIKKGEIDKRKKVWEDKEGPATKKQKKMTAAAEEKGQSQHVLFRYLFHSHPMSIISESASCSG